MNLEKRQHGSTHDTRGRKFGKIKLYVLSGDFLAGDEEVCVFPSQYVAFSGPQKLGLWMTAERLETTNGSSRLTFRAKILSFITVKGPCYNPHIDERSRHVPSQTRDVRTEAALIVSRDYCTIPTNPVGHCHRGVRPPDFR